MPLCKYGCGKPAAQSDGTCGWLGCRQRAADARVVKCDRGCGQPAARGSRWCGSAVRCAELKKDADAAHWRRVIDGDADAVPVEATEVYAGAVAVDSWVDEAVDFGSGSSVLAAAPYQRIGLRRLLSAALAEIPDLAVTREILDASDREDLTQDQCQELGDELRRLTAEAKSRRLTAEAEPELVTAKWHVSETRPRAREGEHWWKPGTSFVRTLTRRPNGSLAWKTNPSLTPPHVSELEPEPKSELELDSLKEITKLVAGGHVRLAGSTLSAVREMERLRMMMECAADHVHVSDVV